MQILDELECSYDKDASGMFVWAKVPPAFKNGEAFSDHILDSTGIFITRDLSSENKEITTLGYLSALH
ncbi:hypothetical protein [Mangrovivirga cuniculi]|uniref:Uncharacterized protein n=1 Tax=Mangrovivirga cuniculi TaxID=2715131 RepID=A0A4D7JQQ0_9BACT|nr:hypothetical protein [Mangrovivirga cuniculi]QCK15102.1 hypothetical protein DCC35_10250 [Mangrovivirga cuniculi]